MSPSIDTGCGSGEALLEVFLKLDDYPGETSWVLEDADGAILNNGDFAGLGDQSTTFEECLPSPCDGSSYTFKILDYYGDGLNNATPTDVTDDGNVKIFFGRREVHEIISFKHQVGVSFDACSFGCGESESLFELILKLDYYYYNDTSWVLEDSNGAVIANVAQGGYEEYYDGAVIQKCLPSPCNGSSYTFTVLDEVGNGLNNGTPDDTTDNGNVEISFGGATVQIIEAFRYQIAVTFDACEHTCKDGESLFELNLSMDYFSWDTSWTIEDSDGDVIADVSVGRYQEYYPEVVYKTCLPSPCDGTFYKYTISDYYGDGLDNNSPTIGTDDGFAKISFGGETVRVLDSFYYSSIVTFDACQQKCVTGESLFELHLEMDYYSEQTRWTLTDSNNALIQSANFGDYKNYYEEVFYRTCLPSPCNGVTTYFLTVFDARNDGLNNGTPDVTDDGVIKVSIDGQLKCEEKQFSSAQYVCTLELDGGAC